MATASESLPHSPPPATTTTTTTTATKTRRRYDCDAVLEACLDIARQNGFKSVCYSVPLNVPYSRAMAKLKRIEARLHADPKLIAYTSDRASCLMFSEKSHPDVYLALESDPKCRYICFSRSRVVDDRVRTTFVPTTLRHIEILKSSFLQFVTDVVLPSDEACCICLEDNDFGDRESQHIACHVCNATMHTTCFSRLPMVMYPDEDDGDDAENARPYIPCPKCRSKLCIGLTTR